MDEYYRVLHLSYKLLRAMLALPPGFVIESYQPDPSLRALTLLIRCPEEEKFHVPEYGRIPEIMGPVQHTNEDGIVDKI